MTKGIFITATGTDVGKTFISALLVKKMKSLGYDCGYYKPVLSGAENRDGKLWAGDCEYVKQIAKLDGNAIDFASFVFEPAVSPHLASIMTNQKIEMSKIKKDFETKKSQHDFLVVEGAGGIVCPLVLNLNETILLKDIIKGLDLDIVIVSSAALGSINSAVLTVEYAKSNDINIQGIILNNFDKNDLMQNDNMLQIKRLTGCDILCTVQSNAKELDIKEKDLLKIFN